MSQERDLLYQYFERHLLREDVDPEETPEQFATHVVLEYWEILERSGQILDRHAQEIREDLEAEVIDMLRKKIYGHFSLREFRSQRKRSG